MSKIVQSIAVYNPQDPWEQAVQNAAKHVTGNWLTSHDCQLLSCAISSLKCGNNDWIDDENLREIRAFYLFAPHMTANKNVMVFTTYLLYLRDILENQEINNVLHYPITFVTIPLAHFIFRERPVHIYINNDIFISQNRDSELYNIGGTLIAEESVKLDGCIMDIKCLGSKDENQVMNDVIHDIKNRTGMTFTKAAARELDRDVFGIEEHISELKPGMRVWNKVSRNYGKIVSVEPSEDGNLHIVYDGVFPDCDVSKSNFNVSFSVV